MYSILLVKPERTILGSDESYIQAVIKAAVAPADLATIAALTPDGYDVDIWDEAVRGRITPATRFPRNYDIVGVGGYTSDLERTIELGRLLRKESRVVVAGGVGVSSEAHRYRDDFDVLFIGEAEYTWPKFLADFEAGTYQSQYRQVSRVDMADSPKPRWDKLAADIDYYAWMVVQTTRGCPFDCEFCDVISLFGRQPRHKAIRQVLDEIRILESMGAVAVMLADDNFYGQRTYYKALLREMAALNRSFRRPLKYWTQITMNIANDEEMLELLVEANVSSLLIGIESPNIESLIETNKPQNYRLVESLASKSQQGPSELVRALKKIQSYGLRIEASLVVGFDHDDVSIFDKQFQFIQDACLSPVSIWTLYAMPGTKLWTRLHREKRVLEEPRLKKFTGLDARAITNIVPKGMTLEELYSGYGNLLKKVHEWNHFEARIEGLISRIEQYPPAMLKVRDLTWKRGLRLLRFMLFTKEGRHIMLRSPADLQASAVAKRLKARITGKSERDRFLTILIDKAVQEQQHTVRYVLPGILEKLDEEIKRLKNEGLPSHEAVVLTVPEAFRKSYDAVFPSVYQRVNNSLHEKSRTEPILVEVFFDFLTRWGPAFNASEDITEPLAEICERAVTRENNHAGEPADGIPAPEIGLSASQDRATDMKIRRLGIEILRCVEEELRSFQHGAVMARQPVSAVASMEQFVEQETSRPA